MLWIEDDIICCRDDYESFITAVMIRRLSFGSHADLPGNLREKVLKIDREMEGKFLIINSAKSLIRKKLTSQSAIIGVGGFGGYPEEVLRWAFRNRKKISLWVNNKPGWALLREEKFLGDRYCGGNDGLVKMIEKQKKVFISGLGGKIENIFQTASLKKGALEDLFSLLVHDAGSQEWDEFEKKYKIPHFMVIEARSWEGLKA
ncbi:MAG: hypothetical protein AUJ72_03410 [Candidatus Omnitrophica bacterium CG1_02_46_14]|nr:MAG: hypothetical protein AUJ72_03410 [Candidatus Omnitrophica bacterium CG1_02_46_14]